MLKRSPAQLSGGQRQRVAIGRAIVRKPKVFLFDEPLSNLDAALRTQMRLEIETLHREIGATLIYVTHDQTEAMTLADRIVALDYGEIQQVGTPDELYNTPTNTFVAGFVGSPKANFLSGVVQSAGETTAVVDVDGATCPTIEINAANLKAGDVVQLGIRPEEFSLSSDVDESHLTFKGHVETADRLGNITYAYVNVGLSDLITVQTFLDRKIKGGEEVTLSVARNRIDVFSPEGFRCSPAKT